MHGVLPYEQQGPCSLLPKKHLWQTGDTRPEASRLSHSPGRRPLGISASQGSGPHGASSLSSWETRTGLGNGKATPAGKRKEKLRGNIRMVPNISLGPPPNGLFGVGREMVCPEGQVSYPGVLRKGSTLCSKARPGRQQSSSGRKCDLSLTQQKGSTS